MFVSQGFEIFQDMAGTVESMKTGLISFSSILG